MKWYSFIFLSLFFFDVNGQAPKTTVILYNLVPLKVDVLPDGSITSIYGKVDNYLKGYQLVRNEENLPQNDAYAQNSVIKVVFKESYLLSFDAERSNLSRDIIETIDKIADIVFFSEGKKMMILPYSPDPAQRNGQTYLENRMKAVLAYLDIKGVDRQRIIINTDSHDKDTHSLLVNVVE